MKLEFLKDKNNNNISVKIQKGTIMEDFSYVSMVKELFDGGEIETPNFINLKIEEKEKIEEMLKEIKLIFQENDDLAEDEC